MNGASQPASQSINQSTLTFVQAYIQYILAIR